MDDLTLLTPEEINPALAGLNSGWSLQSNGLDKTYTFSSFAEAADFVAAIGEVSDDMEGHTPDRVEVRGPSVHLRLFTHSVGGVSVADLDMATVCDRIVQGILEESVAALWGGELEDDNDEE
jgi:pterin-4a-carbinolamine dehydratase